MSSRAGTIIKKYELKIAFVTLLGTLAVSVTTLISQIQHKPGPIIIQNEADLRRLFQKPLEGDWQFVMDYDTFHGIEAPFKAEGEAAITWEPEKKQYLVLLGSKVTEFAKIDQNNEPSTREPIVTYFIRCYIKADTEGLPTDKQVWFEYIFGMGKEGYNTRANHYLTLESFDRTNSVIEFSYKSQNSSGRAKLTRK